MPVHDSAIVDPGAEIGDGTKIWHFCHVSGGATIGRDCVLGQNVFVADGVVVGKNCRIQNNVSLFTGVTLEDDVFCGPSMVFTNVVNPRSAVSRKDHFVPTRVGLGATLGANCTIVCGATIGEFAFVAAGAVVRGDVPAFALVAGVPAHQIGWMSAHGERLDLPVRTDGQPLRASCPGSGQSYVLDGAVLRRDEA